MLVELVFTQKRLERHLGLGSTALLEKVLFIIGAIKSISSAEVASPHRPWQRLISLMPIVVLSGF